MSTDTTKRPDPATHPQWAAYYDLVRAEGFGHDVAYRELLAHGFKPDDPSMRGDVLPERRRDRWRAEKEGHDGGGGGVWLFDSHNVTVQRDLGVKWMVVVDGREGERRFEYLDEAMRFVEDTWGRRSSTNQEEGRLS